MAVFFGKHTATDRDKSEDEAVKSEDEVCEICDSMAKAVMACGVCGRMVCSDCGPFVDVEPVGVMRDVVCRLCQPLYHAKYGQILKDAVSDHEQRLANIFTGWKRESIKQKLEPKR